MQFDQYQLLLFFILAIITVAVFVTTMKRSASINKYHKPSLLLRKGMKLTEIFKIMPKCDDFGTDDEGRIYYIWRYTMKYNDYTVTVYITGGKISEIKRDVKPRNKQ